MVRIAFRWPPTGTPASGLYKPIPSRTKARSWAARRKQGAKEVLMNQNRHLGITLVALYAIIAGLGEIIVGLTGNFLGILSMPLTPTAETVVVGCFYSLGGISILTLRKWGAALGIAFVAAEILGRAYLVATGIAPANGGDAIKIVVGGIIALGVIAYVWSQWRKFH
jgi:hypothetical protein